MSWPALLIIWIPPFIMTLATAVYAALALKWFMKRRAQFNSLLSSSNSGLNASRYFRLLGLALTEMVFSTSAMLFVLILNLQSTPLQPYVSWSYVHDDWMVPTQLARAVIPQSNWVGLLLTWSIAPLSSITFFVFFGLGQETQSEYKACVTWVRHNVLRQKQEAKPILLTSRLVFHSLSELSLSVI